MKLNEEEEAYSEMDQDKIKLIFVIIRFIIIFMGCNLNVQGDPVKNQFLFNYFDN